MTKSSSQIIGETIAAVDAEFEHFKDELKTALDKPVETAEHADTADTLEGKTPAEVSALLVDEVTKHTSKLGVNIHGIDGYQLGSYTGAQFDEKFDKMLDYSSGIPLDFYGDREFIPPAVTGSFESGSNTTPWNAVAMMLEDNGTLTILRSGTDGDNAGVYYSYLRNAMTEPDMANQLMMTNVEYRPAYFPAGQMAKAILSGTQDLVIGVMKNTATGAHTGIFISLTNNTLDATKHTGVIIPLGGFITPPVPQPGLLARPFGFIRGDYVYILHDIRAEGKMGHRVWRIAKNDLITGVFNGATRITGWNINRGPNGGGTVVRDDILLGDSFYDIVNRVGKAHTIIQATNGSDTPTAITEDNGATSVYWVQYMQYWPTDNLVAIGSDHWSFNYDFNEVTKAVDFSKYYDDKLTTTYDTLGNPIYPMTCPASPPRGLGTHFENIFGQDTTSIYTTVFNQMWLWTTVTYTAVSKTMRRFQYPENIRPVTALEGFTAPTSTAAVNPFGNFGSALTNTYMGGGALDEDLVICYNQAKYPNGGVGSVYVRSKLEGEPTFQYSSVTGNYAFKGFAPTNDRKSHLDLGVPFTNFVRQFNEASPGVKKISQARFSSLEPNELSRYADIDRDVKGSGQVTIAAGLMASLRAPIIANMASRGRTLYVPPGGNEMLSYELYIPQAYTDAPAFIVGVFGDVTRYTYHFIYSVTITGTRQNVLTATIIPSSYAAVRFDQVGATLMSMQLDPNGGQTALRRVAGGFMLAVDDGTVVSQIGNAGKAMYLARWANGVWAINDAPPLYNYYSSVAPSAWINLPNRGLFYGVSSEFVYGEIDAGTKMVAALVATTAAVTTTASQMQVRAKASATGIVMISQRVVSAWTVYFADTIPAMLDGFYYSVQPTTYELNSATDGNKTFYVWLVRTGDTIGYQIVVGSTAPPAGHVLYLGYFTTTVTGINLIDVRKRVAIDGYLISQEPRGSAIPTTAGTPNSYGRLAWM